MSRYIPNGGTGRSEGARYAAGGMRRTLAGCAAMGCGLAAQATVHAGAEGVALAPLALAQAVVAITPGWFATAALGLLEAWALRLLVAAAAGLVVACGALPWRWALVLPWVAGPLAALALPDSASLLPSLGAAALAAAVALTVRAALGVHPPADPARRRALVALGALAAVTLAGSALGRLARAATRAVAGGTLTLAREPRPAPAPDPASDPPAVAEARLEPDLTPLDRFYVVDEAIVDPQVDPATWRLSVEGEVGSAFGLSYAELLGLPAVEQVQTLECISNSVGGPLISNTRWTGVPVRELLARAGVRDGVTKVVFASVEGYESSLPLEVALDPATLVAFGMDGRTLPREPGFPARLLIPGRYGMKNVKWLRRIAATREDHLGYWERRGWSDEAIVETMSRLDVPGSIEDLRDGRRVVVAGLAYGGARGVAKVEVSFDDRKTWQAATLGRRFGAMAWRRWALAWTPRAGYYRIAIRAWDDRGRLQTEDERDALPLGATGYHGYQVEVRR